MSTTHLIGLDWGSSSLRAYRMGGQGQILQERSSGDGASQLTGEAARFERALMALAGDWMLDSPAAALVACGMVGSAHGWMQAAYCACPTSMAELTQHAATVALAAHPGRVLRIVPGVSAMQAGRAPDVMRGEETQVMGVLAGSPALAEQSCLVMPGTHSKWVQVRHGRIVDFHTCMTGELFELLSRHSVLSRLMIAAPEFEMDAFLQGVDCARQGTPKDLGSLLFSVRTRGLFGQLPGEALADYLSGLLIGSELDGARGLCNDQSPLVLVGEPALCERYSIAMLHRGLQPVQAACSAAALGMWKLATDAGWTTM